MPEKYRMEQILDSCWVDNKIGFQIVRTFDSKTKEEIESNGVPEGYYDTIKIIANLKGNGDAVLQSWDYSLEGLEKLGIWLITKAAEYKKLTKS